MTSAHRQGGAKIRRRAALIVAGFAVLSGILIVVLSGGGSHSHRSGEHIPVAAPGGPTAVQLAARYLGLSARNLRDKLRAGQSISQIAASHSGRSRRGLIEALYVPKAKAIEARHLPTAKEQAALHRLRRTLTEQVDHVRRRPRVVREAAEYLGIGESALSERLAGGHTLAQVAAATPGKSSAGLVDALISTRTHGIERAVGEHSISKQDAKRVIAHLRRRAERVVTRPGG